MWQFDSNACMSRLSPTILLQERMLTQRDDVIQSVGVASHNIPRLSKRALARDAATTLRDPDAPQAASAVRKEIKST